MAALYPAAALYLSPAYAQKNPATVQSLANAFVRGLKWIAGHSAEEIAKVMPPEHALGDMDLFVRSIRSSMPMYSPDGRFSGEGAETALKVLREFDPAVRERQDRSRRDLHRSLRRQGSAPVDGYRAIMQVCA